MERTPSYRLPAARMVAEVLSQGVETGLVPLQAELCFVMSWISISSIGTLREHFARCTDLRYRFSHGLLGQINNTMRYEPCKKTPWPWEDGLIYDYPYTVCESLVASNAKEIEGPGSGTRDIGLELQINDFSLMWSLSLTLWLIRESF
ncbi:hypothetical protein RRG08_066210 [Elysia crispata]|uniref:Uncharacterized protein n=1 Tax=Elysia crispata TaxID=231223 RepID=A0AAE1BDJ1_9GAST|nr:hypothetical protein RRG08_066210 [Elysia crispata]